MFIIKDKIKEQEMELVDAKMNEAVKVTTTGTLRNMPISKSKALDIPLSDVLSVRNLISRLHKETKLRFKTTKTDSGILVWRLK